MVLSADAFGLDGRKALVTGGATGIGGAVAAALANFGADVAVTMHRRPPDDTLSAVRAAGRKAVALPVDLGNLTPETAAGLVSAACDELGGLDLLVNNAGIIHRAPAMEHDYADWRRVLATNLDSVFLLSQAAARHMATAGGGRIVSIASVLSFEGGVFVPGYATAKHGVVGLTRALANEWAARGINVNAVAPGYVATSNTQALREDPDRSAALLSRIPAGRFAEPDEIAGAVVFLCSAAASYAHGSVVTVDGGWLSR